MKAVGSLGFAAFALLSFAGAATLSACGHEEPYIATRCNESGDHCWQVRCNDDGEDCYPVGSSYGGQYGGRGENGDYGNDNSNDNGNGQARRYWQCDESGNDCHWVYSYPPSPDR